MFFFSGCGYWSKFPSVCFTFSQSTLDCFQISWLYCNTALHATAVCLLHLMRWCGCLQVAISILWLKPIEGSTPADVSYKVKVADRCNVDPPNTCFAVANEQNLLTEVGAVTTCLIVLPGIFGTVSWPCMRFFLLLSAAMMTRMWFVGTFATMGGMLNRVGEMFEVLEDIIDTKINIDDKVPCVPSDLFVWLHEMCTECMIVERANLCILMMWNWKMWPC